MATLNPIHVSPNPVPGGSSGTVTLTFQTDPGAPDLTANITLYRDGIEQQSAANVVLKGRPAELTPSVTAGSTNHGWEIRTDAGVLASQGNNAFTITYS